MGFNGAEFHETPNLDRLAAAGMTFPNGYAGAGNCAPSRACLLSGNYTPRHGVYAVGSTDRGPKKLQRLVRVPNKSGLAKENVILAEALKSAGYTTGIFGKWHLDGKDGAEPAEQGFDIVFDLRAGNPNARRDEPQDPKGVFSITRAACDFIEKTSATGKPFFAYVSHHAIHGALEARPESLAKFKEKAKSSKDGNPLYAACTYDLDAGVGELMEKIRALGIAEKTLVIFTSDNGGTQQSSQEPLRGSKGGYYEGGIREPFLAVWPGVIEPDLKSDAPVINVDLYPTFLALAGGKIAEGKQLDGTDLTPLLTGTAVAPDRNAIFWHFPGYLDQPVIRGRKSDVALGFRSRPVSVIRKGNWKLHLFHEEWMLEGGKDKLATNGAVELYDLSTDPGERHDLALKETARRDELLGDLLTWIASTKATIPAEKNPDYDTSAAARKLAKKTKTVPDPE
ncbi:sulfatase [Luteolibacter arcticus]|uniref:Sulfatase n=1 Tax=Luteolibacter arcticus TaxID=1581411 RepID=A0ABT3GHQ6_9BACT|nr:sulfatase [Luteolibacter arcticus]MCW1922854.1 sulfatase [Luteolibacter arcticus]